jgi:hypothetical protein
MSMLAALQENDRRLAAKAEQQQARVAELEGQQASFLAKRDHAAIAIAEAVQRQRRGLCEVLRNDPLAISIHDMMASRDTPWSGTLTELLYQIGLPGLNARHAGRRLRRLARVLFKAGLTVRAYTSNSRRAVLVKRRDQTQQALG